MLNIILIALIAFGSALILITSGFGFGSLFMAIIPLLIPYQDAAFISVLTTMFLQIAVIAKYFNKINWRLIIIPTVISFITGSIGVHLMVKMTASTMALILGIFLWILAFYMIWIAPKIHLKKSAPIEITVGALSGFMGGMFAIGGPPMVAYYDSIIDDPIEYQATIQTFFFITSINLLINDFLCVKITSQLSLLALASIVGCLLGTFIGNRILQKISMQTVRKLAYLVMLSAGSYNLIKALLKF